MCGLLSFFEVSFRKEICTSEVFCKRAACDPVCVKGHIKFTLNQKEFIARTNLHRKLLQILGAIVIMGRCPLIESWKFQITVVVAQANQSSFFGLYDYFHLIENPRERR